jgi:hypothetical protein
VLIRLLIEEIEEIERKLLRISIAFDFRYSINKQYYFGGVGKKFYFIYIAEIGKLSLA